MIRTFINTSNEDKWFEEKVLFFNTPEEFEQMSFKQLLKTDKMIFLKWKEKQVDCLRFGFDANFGKIYVRSKNIIFKKSTRQQASMTFKHYGIKYIIFRSFSDVEKIFGINRTYETNVEVYRKVK